MMESLFIGGPKDGLRHDAGGRMYYKFAIVPPFSAIAESGPVPENVVFRTVSYRAFRLAGAEVYVYSRLTPEDAIRELIRRYPVAAIEDDER